MRMSSGIGRSGLALLVVGCGATHPLEHETARTEPLTWAVQQIDDPEAAKEDLFGYGVSVSGDTALVGALRIGSDVPGASHGATYAYTRQAGGWLQQGPALSPDDGQDFDNFGQATALDGDMALIAAYDRALYSPLVTSGAVYVFTRTGDTWSQEGPAFAPLDAQGFGSAISISGNTALIGANFSGGVYTYTRSGNTWTQQGAAFSANDPGAFDSFGFALQLVGDTAVIGAYEHSVESGSGQGSAYIFTRNGTSWAQQTEFLSAPGDDVFGVAVALSADASTAVVGAEGTYYTRGAAYVYTRSGTTWTQQGAPLTAPNPAANDHFGASVAIQGDTIWIAAEGGPGAVYRFARSAGVWTQQDPVLHAPANTPSADFGRYMAVSANTVWVSDPYGSSPSGSSQQGEEYVFSLNGDGAAGEAGASGASNDAGASSDAGAGGGSVVVSGGSAGIAGSGGNAGIAGSRGVAGSGGVANSGGNGGGAGATSGVGATSGASGNGGGVTAAGNSGIAGEPSGGASPSSNGTAANDNSSCGCAVVGQRGHGADLWLALGLIGLSARRRRRSLQRT